MAMKAPCTLGVCSSASSRRCTRVADEVRCVCTWATRTATTSPTESTSEGDFGAGVFLLRRFPVRAPAHGGGVDRFQIEDPWLIGRLRHGCEAACQRGAIGIEAIRLQLHLRTAPALPLVDRAQVLPQRHLRCILE